MGEAPNGGIKGENICVHAPYVISHPELIEMGSGTTILPGARIQVYPELIKGGSLSIGKGCYFGYRLCILVGANIRIGDNVLVASDVTLVSENHGMDPESEIPYMDQRLLGESISIGNDCWIGDKVIIIAGATIGDKCIIGAGSVVTKSIPAMCMAAGNPAKIIKKYDVESHKWVRVREQ